MNKMIFRFLGLAAVFAGIVSGCSSGPTGPDPIAVLEQGLTSTAPARAGLLGRDSSAEREAIEQFKKFNSDFSIANIQNNTKQVYDPEVYFIDPFKQLHGEAEFESYLMRSASNIVDFSMEWKDVAVSDGNYYFRWIMSVKMKRDGKDKP